MSELIWMLNVWSWWATVWHSNEVHVCSISNTTRSQTCTSGFKVSVPVLHLGNRPYITIFSTKTHLQDYTSQTPGNTPSVHTRQISIHEHNHITTQTPQVYASVRTYLMSSLSFLFSLPLFWTMSLTIIFSGRKQPCILHLLLFPMKQQHCLYPICHRPLPPIISAVSPLSHTLPLMCSDACTMPVKFFVPAVSLHLSHFTHFTFSHFCMAWHSLTHSSTSITNSSFHAHCTLFPDIHVHVSFFTCTSQDTTSLQSHTDMFMKTTQVFRLATDHTTQFTLIQINLIK